MERYDVIVIGAGAMGSATAWWLARRGRHVLLLEQFEPGHTRGSSHGGSRIFRLAYADPLYARMAHAALPLWHELEDDAGEPLLDRTGGIDHGDTDTLDAIVAALQGCGAEHELLPADAATERWPGFAFAGPVVYSPEGGRCRADATVAALQRRAAELGADVRFGERVEAVVPGDGRADVRTTAGEYQAACGVVTAGAWLAPLIGATVALPPTTVTQEQILHFVPRHPAAGWPSFIHHRQPWIYGLETPGEGIKVAEHAVGPVTDPDHRDVAIDPAGRARVADYVTRWLPGLDPAPVYPATCLYTSTPTEDFVLDRAGALVIGSPCSGHGFKFTPLIGRILADLATGQAEPADLGGDSERADLRSRFRLDSRAAGRQE